MPCSAIHASDCDIAHTVEQPGFGGVGHIDAEEHRHTRTASAGKRRDAIISRPAEVDKPAYVILFHVIVGDREIETG